MYIDTKGKVDYTSSIEQPIAQLQTEKLKFEKRDREEKIMKKKVLSALLAATMVVSMTACGGAKKDEGSVDKPDTQAPATQVLLRTQSQTSSHQQREM